MSYLQINVFYWLPDTMFYYVFLFRRNDNKLITCHLIVQFILSGKNVLLIDHLTSTIEIDVVLKK